MKGQAPSTVEAPPRSPDRDAEERRRSGGGGPGGWPGPQFSVVHLTAEYWPFAQAGGLAEAVRGLAEYQASKGRSVSVILPLYRAVRETADLVPALAVVAPI